MNNLQVRYDVAEEAGSANFLPYLPSIIWQRKWLLIIPALLGLIAALATAFLLPTKYESRAVLLVEAPLLPEDVASDVSGQEVLDQRMARIRQQMLSRPQLIQLIERNGLYPAELRSSSLSEVIATMREAISIAPVSAGIQTTSSGRRSTIAFGMSFQYSDPVKAQAVAQALTEQVLQLDATKTAQQAVSTVEFLTDQQTELQTQITQLAQVISEIKVRNGLALSPNLATAGGGTASIDAQILSIQAANAQLSVQKDLTRSAAERDPVIVQAEANLATALATYSEKHPDVILAKQRLAQAHELAKSNQARIPTLAIDTQLATNNRRLAQLEAARAASESRAGAVANAQIAAPVIQQEIAQYQEKLDNLNDQYRRVSNQLLAARAGKKAEDEQQGERLSLIEAASVPDEPVSPNRPAIIALITGAGLGLGLALILLIELIMKPIRDANAVALATGEAPLIVIPTIMSKGERQRKGIKSLWPFGGGDDDDDDDDDDEDAAVGRKKK
ncbi:uncharacterized protein involved in exopolysaccharide biosynthesis [Sphingobium xanthum]|uniref:GumC family protein n=1 Tax=Sphingobium xanthum TaxID=1387165 RepID=UPI001C8C8B92|nr:Wzz/FepE/Etk N-terminal domain-containing protein [Sphingobium xanthum]